MTRDELREAIVKPAEAVGVKFEPGLVNTILDDVEKRPGSLPLLQFALREMWGRLKTPLLNREDYDAIGGVEGALANRAQAILDAEANHGKDEAAAALFRRLFVRLVTLGDGAEDTRRVVSKEELGADEWSLAQKLAGEDNRIVVTGATTPEKETAEVAHEALIRNWPTLVDWVSRDRAFISWRNQLRQRVDEWRKSPNDEGTFLHGGPLVVAEKWCIQRGNELNEFERAFVAASVNFQKEKHQREENNFKLFQAQSRELEAAHHRNKLLNRLSLGVTGVWAGVFSVEILMFFLAPDFDFFALRSALAIFTLLITSLAVPVSILLAIFSASLAYTNTSSRVFPVFMAGVLSYVSSFLLKYLCEYILPGTAVWLPYSTLLFTNNVQHLITSFAYLIYTFSISILIIKIVCGKQTSRFFDCAFIAIPIAIFQPIQLLLNYYLFKDVDTSTYQSFFWMHAGLQTLAGIAIGAYIPNTAAALILGSKQRS
jgi:hypothetical protein